VHRGRRDRHCCYSILIHKKCGTRTEGDEENTPNRRSKCAVEEGQADKGMDGDSSGGAH
jgi:hypothetical protein